MKSLLKFETPSAKADELATSNDRGAWSINKSILAELKSKLGGSHRKDTAECCSKLSDNLSEKSLAQPQPIRLHSGSLERPITHEDAESLRIHGDSASANSLIILRIEDGCGTAKSFTQHASESGEWCLAVDVSDLADGSLMFSLNQMDKYGNASTPIIRMLKKDSAAPVTLKPISTTHSEEREWAVIRGIADLNTDKVLVTVRRDEIALRTIEAIISDDRSWKTQELDMNSLSTGELSVEILEIDKSGYIAGPKVQSFARGTKSRPEQADDAGDHSKFRANIDVEGSRVASKLNLQPPESGPKVRAFAIERNITATATA